MVFLLSSGFGLVIKSLARLGCSQAARCISLTNALSSKYRTQNTTARWLSDDIDIFEAQKLPSQSDIPKRPRNGFLRYLMEQRILFVSKHPGFNSRLVCKLIAEQWRSLSNAEKQVYLVASKLEYMQYDELVKKLWNQFDPLDLKLLRKEKLEEKKKHQKMLQLQRDLRTFKKPKYPLTSYQIFISEHFKTAKATSVKERLLETAKKYNSLSSTERQVYFQLAEVDKLRYVNERKAFEKRMIDLGREDIIQLCKPHKVYIDTIEREKMESATQTNTESKNKENP